jgi:hypothetical protein
LWSKLGELPHPRHLLPEDRNVRNHLPMTAESSMLSAFWNTSLCRFRCIWKMPSSSCGTIHAFSSSRPGQKSLRPMPSAGIVSMKPKPSIRLSSAPMKALGTTWLSCQKSMSNRGWTLSLGSWQRLARSLGLVYPALVEACLAEFSVRATRPNPFRRSRLLPIHSLYRVWNLHQCRRRCSRFSC